MKFKRFINEFTMPMSNYGMNVRYGYWNLPTLNPQYMMLKYPPAGGFKNFSQMLQYKQQIIQANEEMFIESNTLEQFSRLAEAAATAIEEKDPNKQKAHGHYKQAYIDPKNRKIHGMEINDIVSGLYPRLKLEELRRGIDLGVLIKEPNNMYCLDINLLETKIIELSGKLAEIYHKFQQQSFFVGQLDRGIASVSQNLFGQGNVPLGPSIPVRSS